MRGRSESLLTLRTAHIASLLVLVAMFAASAFAWPEVEDDRVPVHWGFSGEPDRYGGKVEGLLVMPLVAAGLVALLAIVPHIEPRRTHLRQSESAYVAVWLGLLGFFALMHGAAIATALGGDVSMSLVVGAGFGVVAIVIGVVLGSVRSNYMFGVRTPWTLSSELSWERTHRLAGRLFVAAGGITLVASLVGAVTSVPWLPVAALLVTTLTATIVSVVYSFIVWRGDPDKQAFGR